MKFYSKKSLYHINFVVENSRSDKTSCDICNKMLKLGEIRVVYPKVLKKSDYFHLRCFKPKSKQYIITSDLKIYLNNESEQKFYTWLDNWNSKYFPLDQTLYCPEIALALKLETKITNKRIFLEVFKFLTVNELMNSVNRVNKNFYSLTWDEELWNFLSNRDFNVIPSHSEYKKFYVQCYYSYCIECKTLPVEKKFSKCPLLKRTLCKKCLKLDKYTLLNKSQILKIYGTNAELVKVSWWTYDGYQMVTYRFLFEDKLFKFRESQKEQVIQFLRAHCTNAKVNLAFENLDVRNIDIKEPDDEYDDLVLWKPNYLLDVSGKIFKDLFEFIRKGKNLVLSKFIGNKSLK